MYGTHGILSMNKGIAAPIMTAMEDTMNNILRVCWFIFIVCVIVLFFIFDEIDVFVGFTHKILFARDLFNDIFVGFQFFYSTVVVFGRIVLCRYLFTQVVDFGIVFYALYTAVFIDEDDENNEYFYPGDKDNGYENMKNYVMWFYNLLDGIEDEELDRKVKKYFLKGNISDTDGTLYVDESTLIKVKDHGISRK